MTLAIMNRQHVRTVLGALLLVAGVQFSCTSQLSAQQADFRAVAAAKAAAGREARTHAVTGLPRLNAAGAFTSFDAPGAGTSRGQGTFPASISMEGAITGTFTDANFVNHGFLRASNGAFVTFDVPAAVDSFFSVTSINPAGAITGFYFDATPAGHGFLRTRNGVITTFDAPGAGQGFFQGTFPFSMNPAGAITGFYADANGVGHGFLRASNGSITTFDAPATINPGGCFNFGGFFTGGTQAIGINPDGTITGIYTDTNCFGHGFLRASDGTITTFDAPGSIGPFAIFSFGPDLYINPQGVITGTYFQLISGNPSGGNFRVFVRALDGTFTTFDAATYPPCCIFSFPSGLTPAGAITGSFNDGFNINHGFLRASDGTITTFDDPNAGTGTAPLGITPGGVIMGFYGDTNNVSHGFLFRPRP